MLAVRRQDRAVIHRPLAELACLLAITVKEGKDRGFVLECLGIPLGPGFGHVFGFSLGAQALADNLTGVLGNTKRCSG